ncbi:hypothetical protein BgiMline_003637, partial [Biomphalaria glabrata]
MRYLARSMNAIRQRGSKCGSDLQEVRRKKNPQETNARSVVCSIEDKGVVRNEGA